MCCCCCCCFFPDDGEEEEEEAFLLVKFAATTLTFPLLLRLERVLMRRRGVEDAELLDDTNPEGDAKEEAIFFLFFSVAREVRVEGVRN